MGYVSADAFAAPAFTVFPDGSATYNAPGTFGRDILRGPGSSNIDVSVFKVFSVTEKIKGQFRMQAYNLTNTPHFENPNGSLGGIQGTAFVPNSQFGQITSTVPFTYRQLEMGLRVTF